MARRQVHGDAEPERPILDPLHITAASLTDSLPDLPLLSSGNEDNNNPHTPQSSLASLSSDSLDSGSWWSTSDMSDSESEDEELLRTDTFMTFADRPGDPSGDSDAGWDGDDESDGLGAGDSCRMIRDFVVNKLKTMYAQRYELPRHRLPRGPPYLPHVLNILKVRRPNHFRQALRVSPSTFNTIVQRISDDPVFSNQSNQSQIPVEDQLAIALYRFGHNGNAASLQSVANWAGVGKGTVTLATRRVMTAILRPDFMNSAVRMPDDVEKEAAKEWVAAHSCDAWRDGWCMVDGTLVPLFARPYWYGSSYFDRKSNYSMNVQVSALTVGKGHY
jgi:hypothetical protein